jgi:hypothetical protein
MKENKLLWILVPLLLTNNGAKNKFEYIVSSVVAALQLVLHTKQHDFVVGQPVGFRHSLLRNSVLMIAVHCQPPQRLGG